jgi:hypothetical protein
MFYTHPTPLPKISALLANIPVYVSRMHPFLRTHAACSQLNNKGRYSLLPALQVHF